MLLFPLGVVTLPEVGSMIISYCTTGNHDHSYHFVQPQQKHEFGKSASNAQGIVLRKCQLDRCYFSQFERYLWVKFVKENCFRMMVFCGLRS